MMTPILSKTWNFHVNQITPVQATESESCKKAVFAFKEYLVTTLGWTVDRSCDGLNDPISGDSWTDWTKLIWGGLTVSYFSSWIIFNHPVSGQLLFRCTATYGDTEWHRGYLVWSPVNAFTGGGRFGNNTPTAVGQRILISNSDFLTRTGNVQRVWHFMATDDHRSVRMIQVSNNIVYTSIFMDMPPIPHQSFTNRVVAYGTGGTNFLTYANLHRSALMVGESIPGVALSISLACESILSKGLGEVWNTPDIDGELPMLEVEAWADNATSRYSLGTIPDMWLGPTGYANNGDTYSDSLGNPRKFVQFNHLILPWDGSTPVMA